MRAYDPYLTSLSQLKIHVLNMKQTLNEMKFSSSDDSCSALKTIFSLPTDCSKLANFVYPLFFIIESR